MKALLRLQLLLSSGILAGAAFLTLLHILVNRRTTVYQTDYTSAMLHAFGTGIILGTAVIVSAVAERTSRWEQYIRSLPVSGKTRTDAKYLFSLLTALAAAALTGTEAAFTKFMEPRHTGSPAFAPVPAAAALAAAWTLLVSGFLLFAVSRRIRRKGITAFLPFLLTGIAVFFPMSSFFMHFSDKLMWYCFYEDEPVSRITLLYPYWALAGSAVLYLISWRLSRRMSCRRKRREPHARSAA